MAELLARLGPLAAIQIVGAELHGQEPVGGREADAFLQRRLDQFAASLPRLQLRQRAVRRGVELVEPKRRFELVTGEVVLIGEGVQEPERHVRRRQIRRDGQARAARPRVPVR